MDWLDVKYISLIQPLVRNFKPKGNNLWSFSCPICGDSVTRTHLGRGYIFDKDGTARYMCHNCGASSTFQYFLKNLNPSLYKQYRLEKYKPKKKFDYNDIKEEVEHKTGIELLFEPLTDKAKAYLKTREITNISDIYSISSMKKFESFFPDKELPDDERIVFPIRNRQSTVIGLSARSLDPKNKMRYVLLKLIDEPLIFGLDKINLSKDVFVLEGAIDSLHLDNAVAVNGSDLIKVSELIPKNKQILVYDNQPRSREIVNKMNMAMKLKYNVVIWPKDIIEKDVNLMVRKYGIDKVNEWLMNSYHGLSLKAKIVDWKLI